MTDTSSEDDQNSIQSSSYSRFTKHNEPKISHVPRTSQIYHPQGENSSSVPANADDTFHQNFTSFNTQLYTVVTWEQLQSQYQISAVFAEGNFAQVRKAQKKSSKVDFVMKIIPKDKINKREIIDNEINIMQRNTF